METVERRFNDMENMKTRLRSRLSERLWTKTCELVLKVLELERREL